MQHQLQNILNVLRFVHVIDLRPWPSFCATSCQHRLCSLPAVWRLHQGLPWRQASDETDRSKLQVWLGGDMCCCVAHACLAHASFRSELLTEACVMRQIKSNFMWLGGCWMHVLLRGPYLPIPARPKILERPTLQPPCPHTLNLQQALAPQARTFNHALPCNCPATALQVLGQTPGSTGRCGYQPHHQPHQLLSQAQLSPGSAL